MGWGITRVHVSCQGGGGANCHWESVGGFFRRLSGNMEVKKLFAIKTVFEPGYSVFASVKIYLEILSFWGDWGFDVGCCSLSQ